MERNTETPVSLSQIGLYNPQRQSSELTEKLFVVRQKQFELLLDKIIQERESSIPQHHIIIGQRGMGKTTMLKRLEVELHKQQYRQQFIPLLFPEEQYNVKNLAGFWLNCLDALADNLELEAKEKYQVIITDIDKNIKELSKKTPEAVSENAYKYLMDICNNLNRRPVLLIDNISFALNWSNYKKNEQEQWALRKILSENGAPIIIGAGVTVTNEITNYNKPFYDLFQIQYLYKLSFEEFTELLYNLANLTQINIDLTPLLRKEKPRLQTLYQFTGGNPRTVIMLFKLLVKGFSADINDDLDALVDEITPLYKAKFEQELSRQQQIVIDAIAMNWDAISIKELSVMTNFKNTQLSPQLERLKEDGWIETTVAYKAKGNAYFISERFFNIWYLLRRSNRRQKKGVHSLSEFLECLYRPEKSLQEADCFLDKTLSELYNQNKGLAREHVLQAFEILEKEKKISTIANNNWWAKFGSIVINLNYGLWLLDILKDKNYDIVLSPFYTAIQALKIEKHDSKNGKEKAELYLKNRAIEISDPARTIIEKMKKYMS